MRNVFLITLFISQSLFAHQYICVDEGCKYSTNSLNDFVTHVQSESSNKWQILIPKKEPVQITREMNRRISRSFNRNEYLKKVKGYRSFAQSKGVTTEENAYESCDDGDRLEEEDVESLTKKLSNLSTKLNKLNGYVSSTDHADKERDFHLNLHCECLHLFEDIYSYSPSEKIKTRQDIEEMHAKNIEDQDVFLQKRSCSPHSVVEVFESVPNITFFGLYFTRYEAEKKIYRKAMTQDFDYIGLFKNRSMSRLHFTLFIPNNNKTQRAFIVDTASGCGTEEYSSHLLDFELLKQNEIAQNNVRAQLYESCQLSNKNGHEERLMLQTTLNREKVWVLQFDKPILLRVGRNLVRIRLEKTVKKMKAELLSAIDEDED